jgi:hypothetical protein
VDSALQPELLASCYEAESRPSFDLPKLLVWIGSAAASWALVIGLGWLIWG